MAVLSGRFWGFVSAQARSHYGHYRARDRAPEVLQEGMKKDEAMRAVWMAKERVRVERSPVRACLARLQSLLCILKFAGSVTTALVN